MWIKGLLCVKNVKYLDFVYKFMLLYTMKTTINNGVLVTAKGARFDLSKPAKSKIIMVLNDKGQRVMDVLRLTGKFTEEMEDMEPVTMIEVEYSFGVAEVNEDIIWQ